MKAVFSLIIALIASLAGAVTVHRSFRNGYPSGAQGVTVRQQPNAAVLTAPKMAQAKTKVVTNRVSLTKEQAEKLMKKKGLACGGPALAIKKFKELTGTADRIVIREGGFDCCGKVGTTEKDGKRLLVITNAAEIAEFNALFDFKAEDCGECMCCGYPGIDWYRKGKRIALTAMQHGHSLRWKGFKSGSDKFGDCYYTDESKAKLTDWFKAHLPKLAEDPRCKDWLGPKTEGTKQ